MTTIDFYFNASDRLQVACRLAAKAASQRRSLLVYAPDGDTASRFDKLLWTWPATGFVPHCALRDPLAPQTPVLIAADDEAPPRCEVLLNLASACPPHFERFERLLELVGADEAERAAGRERYRYYRSRGYAISHHDLTQQEAAG
ncbi:MAG TPA: DNA polymerase III subunit chi [Burkholderiales bacterium]|nr:DNA polymerase III subunit chi [Burkholderiales bacterium]